MNEAQRRAWQALDIGPIWWQRKPTALAAADLAQAVVDSEAVNAPAPSADRTNVNESATPHQRPQALSLSWADLRDQVLGCQKCALAQGRHQVVFGSGPAPATWMVVGEAPGEQEDLKGVPFVGPAGQLLDQMLAAIGVDRASEVFVANVLKCRPPRNRDPQADEIAQCSPWLQAQIAAVQPRIILAVGRFAAQTLLQTDTAIGRLRGGVHALPRPAPSGQMADGSDIPVVVTYHPSYLLRSPAEKGKAWQDLLLARSLIA